MAENVTETLAEDVLDTDATWILTSVFIIFTMQSGFGLLESGFVQRKNAAAVMMKNAADILFGGLTYWIFGYGLSFGPPGQNNPFCGEGNFFAHQDGPGMGSFYANFIFQLSFATTATTIVSGGMAERTSLTAYNVFSMINTFVYAIPAHWMWGERGFLGTFGALDFAGSGVVHLTGGVSALVAAVILGPRKGRYDDDKEKDWPMGNANQAMFGMFMLWWGWLGFNCGSSFGIVQGKWIIAAKAAVTTINAAIAGGCGAMIFSFFKGMDCRYAYRRRVYSIPDLITGVLGALVAITAGCAMVQPWEALIIGLVGAMLSILTVPMLDRLRVDDPVGAFAVHGTSGIWGLLAVGLFADVDSVADVTSGARGVFHGGDGWLLLAQIVAVLAITAWSAVVSFLVLLAIHKTIGLRMSPEEEELGADYVEHDVPLPGSPSDFTRAPAITCHKGFKRFWRRGHNVDINVEDGRGNNNGSVASDTTSKL